MYIKWPKGITSFLGFFSKILHERLRLSPNQVSIISFITSLAAAGLIYSHNLKIAFIFLFLSLFLDALDGAIARQYHLESVLGRRLELIFDRTAELALFLSLAAVNLVSWQLAGLAWAMIMIMTLISQQTRIDFGFKRIMIFSGPIIGFSVALYIVIGAQLSSIIIGIIIKVATKYVRA